MKKNDKVTREIALSFEFLREIIDDPSLTKKIPDGAAVVFIDNGEKIPKRKTTPSGEPIKYIRIKRLFEVAA